MTVDSITHSFATKKDDIQDTLSQASYLIARREGRFTPIRKHIYKCLLEAPYPLGAYEIIDEIKGVGSQKPPTVYRALSWLIDNGLVAKIEYNSKYTTIPLDMEADDLAFVICRECGGTDTLKAPGLSKSLHQTAKDRGFAETQMVLEIIGLCNGHEMENSK